MKNIVALLIVCLSSNPSTILSTSQAAESLLVESLVGPVTPAELQAFKQFMRTVPMPENNARNAMVYGGGGMAVESLGRMFEISGDRELLDRMLAFTDRMLAGRNDAQTGVVVWTGKRELVWPNGVAVNSVDATSAASATAVAATEKPLYSGPENGDIIGHIAYAAKMILQHRPLWSENASDGDPFHFGATYRDRAERYVRELDRTLDTFVLKWLVRPDTNRYFSPDSPLYEAAARPGSMNRPVPWNQQMMLNNGFQRMAECHTLLGDDADRVRRYEAIVQASVDWFFEMVERPIVDGHSCYKWAYVAERPLVHIEDYGHGGEDVTGLYRAYESKRYGITAEMMLPFANTVLYVMRTPEGKFSPRVDGVPNERDRPAGGLRSPWIDLAEFAPELLPLLHEVNRGRIKSSPELAATILWQKHRAAMKSP